MLNEKENNYNVIFLNLYFYRSLYKVGYIYILYTVY
jgi:hypothetical protein